MYEDEDSEDVDTHELVRMLKVPTNKTEQKPAGVDIMQAGTKEEDINETLEDRTGEQNNGKRCKPGSRLLTADNEQEKTWTTLNATGKRNRKQKGRCRTMAQCPTGKQLEEYTPPIQNL